MKKLAYKITLDYPYGTTRLYIGSPITGFVYKNNTFTNHVISLTYQQIQDMMKMKQYEIIELSPEELFAEML